MKTRTRPAHPSRRPLLPLGARRLALFACLGALACAGPRPAATGQADASGTLPSTALVVENQSRVNVQIYAVSTMNRASTRIGEVRSLSRASFALDLLVSGNPTEYLLVAAPVNRLDERDGTAPPVQATLSQHVSLAPGQRIVWRLAGFDEPRSWSFSVD